jgi:hypothetical protein
MNIRNIVTLACLALFSIPSEGQDTVHGGPVSWGGGYGEECRAVVLTEAGLYATTARGGLRGLSTLGILVKTGISDAIGGDMFLYIDEEQGSGWELRYRHWFDRQHTIDAGIGLPTSRENAGTNWQTSPYMMVKWSPVEWFGLTLRPEYRSFSTIKSWWDPGTGYHTSTSQRGHWYFSGGVELAGPTGFAIQSTAAVLALLIAASALHNL